MKKNHGGPAFGQWLPIESAPKGEIVLIYWPEIEGRNALRPMIRADYVGMTPNRPPTYWMPLPPPPAKDQP